MWVINLFFSSTVINNSQKAANIVWIWLNVIVVVFSPVPLGYAGGERESREGFRELQEEENGKE